MKVPEKLESAINDALKVVHENPIHHFPSSNRKQLMDVFFEIGTPSAELARKRLAILSARRVLHFYVPPNCEKYSEDFRDEADLMSFPQENRADYAIELAEKVVAGLYPVQDAYGLACNAHYHTGLCMPLRSQLADMAANRALVEVSSPDPQRLYEYGLRWEKSNEIQVVGIFEAAPSAALALACEIDPSQVDENIFPDNWNWWIDNNTPVNSQKMLAFWEWYFLEAIPQVWEQLEEVI